MVKIPNRLEDLYPAGAIERVLQTLQQPEITGKVREALERVGMPDVNPLEQVQQAWQHARNWLDSLTRGATFSTGQAPTLNATGQLLTDSLPRIPPHPAAAQALARAALEYQHVGAIAAHVDQLAASMMDASHVSWQVSIAEALHTLVGSRQVLVAKADLVRIPGLGDLGAMLEPLERVEVGAANGCSPSDWQTSLQTQVPDSGRCVLLVRPDRQSGQPPKPEIDLSQVLGGQPWRSGVPVFVLQADATASPTLATQFGFSKLGQLPSGAQAAVAPLHLLLAGPPGAVIVGDEATVSTARRQAQQRGTDLNGPELLAGLAAIQATSQDDAGDGSAVGRLHTTPENLQNRAERMAIQLSGSPLLTKAEVLLRKTPLGSDPWDGFELESWAIRLTPRDDADSIWALLLNPVAEHGQIGSADQGPIEAEENTLTSNTPSILGVREQQSIWLDLRFIDPKDDHLLVARLAPDLMSVADVAEDAATDSDGSEDAG